MRAELPPFGGRLFEELHEPRPANGVAGRSKRQLPPGHVGLPELVDLGIDALQPKLPARGPCLPPPLVDIDQPLSERLAVGHVGGGRILEPSAATARRLKDRQFEQLSQFLVFGDQKRDVFPGLWPHEPVEQQFIGMPLHDGGPGARGEPWGLRVADRFGMPAGERVERHHAAVLEHRNLAPGRQRGLEPRRGSVGGGGGRWTDCHEPHQQCQQDANSRSCQANHHPPPG